MVQANTWGCADGVIPGIENSKLGSHDPSLQFPQASQLTPSSTYPRLLRSRDPSLTNVQHPGQTHRHETIVGDAWGCLTHLPPSTYVCSPSGFGQGQSRACSHRLAHLWASPGRCGHSHGLCSCSSYPLRRKTDKTEVGGQQNQKRESLRLRSDDL